MKICEFITLQTSLASCMLRKPSMAIFRDVFFERHQNQFKNVKY